MILITVMMMRKETESPRQSEPSMTLNRKNKPHQSILLTAGGGRVELLYIYTSVIKNKPIVKFIFLCSNGREQF